ncbi:MAG TPA: carbohydrate ABC transporter permease, partial [Caldilineaceae bacterium]|nr:carbohydrate ABC transporter permease [Caldilineaceae bacterium]
MAQLAQSSAQTASEPDTTQRKRGWQGQKQLASVTRHALLIAVSILFVFPFYWMVVTALKENTRVFTYPIEWLPNPVRWDNFARAINYEGFPFFLYLRNSIYYALSVMVGTVISCAAVGYGFARLRFPGRDLLFVITVATLMIPGIVTFIPTFILFKNLGMLGTYSPLILPAFFGNAFFIFMMRQFFQGLPVELADAARVDGASELRIFWQIMLPLVRPALLVMAVFTFLWTWHEFFTPLVYLSDSSQYPLSLGLFTFRAQRITEWSLMMAASTLVTLPLIVVFFFAQRYFLEGIRMT